MRHAVPKSRRYIVEEYSALEEASDVRHEFFEGEVFAMAGLTIPKLGLTMTLGRGAGVAPMRTYELHSKAGKLPD